MRCSFWAMNSFRMSFWRVPRRVARASARSSGRSNMPISILAARGRIQRAAADGRLTLVQPVQPYSIPGQELLAHVRCEARHLLLDVLARPGPGRDAVRVV